MIAVIPTLTLSCQCDGISENDEGANWYTVHASMHTISIPWLWERIDDNWWCDLQSKNQYCSKCNFIQACTRMKVMTLLQGPERHLMAMITAQRHINHPVLMHKLSTISIFACSRALPVPAKSYDQAITLSHQMIKWYECHYISRVSRLLRVVAWFVDQPSGLSPLSKRSL